jgi:hypothetical protein
MLVVTRTFHHNRRRLIHSFPGHLRRCNHQSNRLLDQVMDICRACHQTSDYHPSSLLHLVELLTLPWLSSSVKCSINPKQSSQAAMVPQDSLIRSGLSSLISCEMINSPKFLLMLHAHATKKHFLQATSRHRMISTLVEHSFSSLFSPPHLRQQFKAEVLLRHAHPSDFVCKKVPKLYTLPSLLAK